MPLCLSRKVGESIVIGDGPGRIVVRVERIEPHKTRLSIQAPREVPIMRGEMLDRQSQRGLTGEQLRVRIASGESHYQEIAEELDRDELP